MVIMLLDIFLLLKYNYVAVYAHPAFPYQLAF